MPLLFAEVALASMRNSPHVELRRVRAAATSGLALSLAVAYCSLFVYAAGQTEAQADFSYFKTSEPGESTRKMVESFDAPLKITAFFPDVSDVRHEVAGYLTQLTQGVPDVELARRNHVPVAARDEVGVVGVSPLEVDELSRRGIVLVELEGARVHGN